MGKYKGTIGILTGGGDVPGLNPAIRAVTIRATREGYRVIGIRRGWAGLVDLVRDTDADNSENFQVLTEDVVNRAGRTGGTFLHSSRTRPSHLPVDLVPESHQSVYSDEINDITPEILRNIEYLGLDYLIPIGGDDTLSYGQRLHQEGVKVVAIPKTMDNDVPGTDYCIGFGTWRYEDNRTDTHTQDVSRIAREVSGYRGLRSIRWLYSARTDYGRSGPPVRDSRVRIRPRTSY